MKKIYRDIEDWLASNNGRRILDNCHLNRFIDISMHERDNHMIMLLSIRPLPSLPLSLGERQDYPLFKMSAIINGKIPIGQIIELPSLRREVRVNHLFVVSEEQDNYSNVSIVHKDYFSIFSVDDRMALIVASEGDRILEYGRKRK